MIITIDGPAGSGKSTAARLLAGSLGIAFLDTGATYRAVTLKALRAGIDMEDETALPALARDSDLKLTPSESGSRVLLDGQDVTREIRSEEVSDMSYYVASSPKVRDVLVSLQRRLGAELGDFVAEGRDQGSVVFPEADIKLFLDASPEVRARRRFEEIAAAGEKVEYEAVLRAIIDRDSRDRTRDVAPLVKPEGAIEIDTSGKTIEQTAAEVLRVVEARM